MFSKGATEYECTACADGFTFDEKSKQCLSLCPNGNFYSKENRVSITNKCKELL